MKGRVKQGVMSKPFKLNGHKYTLDMSGFSGELTYYDTTVWMDFDEETKWKLRTPEYGVYINSCIQEGNSTDCYVFMINEVEEYK
jgi:hypothetical protein